MILKISVHDNDFGELMEEFCRQISKGWHYPKEHEPDKKDTARFGEWYYRNMKDTRFLREVFGRSLREISKDDKDRAIQIVTDSFVYFTGSLDDEDAKYLRKKFSCEIIGSVTDKWENGEIYYVFPSSYADKVLCF